MIRIGTWILEDITMVHHIAERHSCTKHARVGGLNFNG
jgi:hypothetical protein